MTSPLHDVLSEHKADLSDAVVRRLSTAGPSQYQRLEKGELQTRAEKLVDVLLNSVKEKPDVFVEYLEQIAQKRIAEGIHLHDIQAALQVLEEQAWMLVVDLVPQADQVRSLGRITGTVGAAKDRLAHIYLEQLQRAESRSVFLQRRLDALAKGTDPGPLDEEDLPG